MKVTNSGTCTHSQSAARGHEHMEVLWYLTRERQSQRIKSRRRRRNLRKEKTTRTRKTNMEGAQREVMVRP